MYAACDGSFIPEWFADYLDRRAQQARSYAYLADIHHRHPVTPEEKRVVDALLVIAERVGAEERAAFTASEWRSEGADEAARLVHDHGIDSAIVVPFKGLAESRGVSLETTLRAWMRGELRDIVRLPPRQREDVDA